MQLSGFQKTSLGISGTIAFVIGAFILAAPHAFYASYGITLDRDPNLLSELRAPGAGLAVLGAIMLSGVFRVSSAPGAILVAFTVYVAFPLGRCLSIALDGLPSGAILGALFVELAIACLLLVAFGRQRRPARRAIG